MSLGFCTSSQNHFNQQKTYSHNTSGYRGVYFHKGNKRWASRLKYLQKDYWLGTFKTKEEAAKAYDKKAKELFGEFCGKLNFE